MVTEDQIWAILENVSDPEVPVLTVVDLGVVRRVAIGSMIQIDITPTYSGCPAMGVIEENIALELKKNGISNFQFFTLYEFTEKKTNQLFT